ncbi:MAG: DUF2339 domain-containing protein [Zoogloea sp.]|uniref:DUF2339 domain-containing protein n=1 Tax=Zoogloea sp. TaxID=49181 RepID=UPI00261565A9|nr:DUF2339 domain-containing protein [Zoogloea sp.]MDD3329572.1 DUF2339 domain-containing protein [Zoogloea sp.]
MWFVGALLGLVLGGLVLGDSGFLVGALAGGFAAHFLKTRLVPTQQDELESRVAVLEEDLRRLRHEVERLRGGGAPAAKEGSAAEPEPPPAASAPEWEPVQALAAPPEPALDAVAISPSAPQPQPVRQEDEDRGRAIEVPGWLSRLSVGNPLAKIGVVLLFFGVASGLKLAIEHGFFPLWLRLALVGVAGMSLIAFGFRKAREAAHRGFGLALQGGGFAVLYLTGYFMLARYGMLSEGPAFVLFAVLGVACVLLAARQDGPALAVLGISGAFLAPVLAGGRSETPLPLFSYFALLNVFVLGVNWFKAWRSLNIAGFVLTLVIGMAWGVDHYRHSHYLVTQAFVVLFLAAYSAMPVATALLRVPGLAAWHEGILLFGVPLAGCGLQMALVGDLEYGLAWSAFVGALWYFMLGGLLLRRGEPANGLLEQACLGIAGVLLTLAVPLAFGARLTSALWALEGSAVLWLGVRRGRPLVQVAGLGVQILAGAALLFGWDALVRRLPVANDAILGVLLLAAAGFFSARVLRGVAQPFVVAWVPLAWGLFWWFGGAVDEIQRFAPADLQAPIGLGFVTLTVLILEGLARGWRWAGLRAGASLLPAGLLVAVMLSVVRSGHPLDGWMAAALPAAIVVHGLLLRAHERVAELPAEPAVAVLLEDLVMFRHLSVWWLLVWLLPAELDWQVGRLAPGVELWSWVVWTLAVGAALGGALIGQARGWWPFRVAAARYVPVGVAPLVPALVLLLAWGNLSLSGGGSGLPYLPVLSIFDLVQAIGFAALWRAAGQLAPASRGFSRMGIMALAFLWLSTLAGRITHHFGGVPFELSALLASSLFQAVLTLFWTVTAIATMIHASRRHRREQWFAGFALLVVVGGKLLLFDASGRGTATWTLTLIGVALLVLAASYFAPLPPRAAAVPEQGRG